MTPVDAIGRSYNRRPDGRPPATPTGRPGFWARLTGGANPYSWERLQSNAVGPVEPPVTGDLNAYEVNDDTRLAAGTVVWMRPDNEGTFRFWASVPGDLASFWAEITENVDAPEYGIEPGGLATEVNGVLGIDVGTVVRVFGRPEDEDKKFEYSAGAAPPMENSFDWVEIWPARVSLVEIDDNIVAEIWIPGGGFPPVGDDYALGVGKDIAYVKVGDGSFKDGTLEPALRSFDPEHPEDCDWIQVRCEPAPFGFWPANTPVPPDGHINTFSGALGFQPLPYSFTFEYEFAPGRFKRMYCNRDSIDPADGFKVNLEGDGVGWVKIREGTWSVVLNDCPPTGAVMRIRCIRAEDCEWSWVQVAHTVPDLGGIIAMWGGLLNEIPLGWTLCDGRVDSKGSVTPDLRSRFVVGYDDGDADYDAMGKSGGFKMHGAPGNQHDNHTHQIQKVEGGAVEVAAVDGHEHSETDNRPPYYVLAFIRKD